MRLTLWNCFDMGVESRDGGVYNRPGHASLKVTSSITTDPGTVFEQRHAGGSVSFNVKNAINFINYTSLKRSKTQASYQSRLYITPGIN